MINENEWNGSYLFLQINFIYIDSSISHKGALKNEDSCFIFLIQGQNITYV